MPLLNFSECHYWYDIFSSNMMRLFFHTDLTSMKHRDMYGSIKMSLAVISYPPCTRPPVFQKTKKYSEYTSSGSSIPHWYPDSFLVIYLHTRAVFLILGKDGYLSTFSINNHLWSINFQVVMPRCSETLTIIFCSLPTTLGPWWPKCLITRKVRLLVFCLLAVEAF